jgi:hypothetical protein
VVVRTGGCFGIPFASLMARDHRELSAAGHQAYICPMADRELDVANLRVKISILRREQQRLFALLSSDSLTPEERRTAEKALEESRVEMHAGIVAISRLGSAA